MSDRNTKKIVEWALEENLPIFIHISSAEQVQEFICTANEFKENTFIVAHLIGFDEIYNGAKNPNLYYEISPPQLVPVRKLKNAIARVGADRLILGSDTPYGRGNLKINLERIDRLDISESEKSMIKGDNMHRLLFSR
jgi:predicted TIM-barrel fold metal-dependent hydrolase